MQLISTRMRKFLKKLCFQVLSHSGLECKYLLAIKRVTCPYYTPNDHSKYNPTDITSAEAVSYEDAILAARQRRIGIIKQE